MDVKQTDNFNRADIEQEDGELMLAQLGTDHEFNSYQIAGSSDIHQSGYSNIIMVDQIESRTPIFQDGSNNKASLLQM
jgi:hypothetical protein